MFRPVGSNATRPLADSSTHISVLIFLQPSSVGKEGGTIKISSIIKLSQTQKGCKEGRVPGWGEKVGSIFFVESYQSDFPRTEVARWHCLASAAAAEEQKEQSDGNWLPYLCVDRLNDVTLRYALGHCILQVPRPCPSPRNVPGITQRNACVNM